MAHVFESLLFCYLTSCLQRVVHPVPPYKASLSQGMQTKGKGAWQSKRGPTPALPPYRPPGQRRSPRVEQVEKCKEIIEVGDNEANQEVIEVVDSEVNKEVIEMIPDMVESRSDSEEDTCFGVVWERVEEIKDKNVTVVTEHWVCPFAGLVIPETEDQQDAQKSAEEDDVPFCTLLAKEKADKIGKDVIQNGDEFIGMSVAKKFEIVGRLEEFKGTVKEVTELRKRRLYAIVYEDGVYEDLNEQEFRGACELFIALENNDEEMPDTDDGKEEYNSDVEISEYSCSDASDEEHSFLPPSKKRRTKKQLKEAESNAGCRNTSHILVTAKTSSLG